MPNFRPLRMWTLAAAACALVVAHGATAAVTWTKFLGGFAQPVEIVGARDGSARLFVVQQTGVVRVVKNGAALATPFLDLGALTASSGERGLLGLAFHPQFATNRQFFVNYTRASDNATVIARYTASATTPDVADPASATVLLVIAQPYDNHKGGAIKFGADGYLYIGMGDGGSGNDPEGRAQDKTTLLGKILRIDVNSGNPYAIPAGNPYATGVGGRPEIFAIGLRNPWRISFDRATGDFWIGDVGQGAVEEIDMLPAGTGAGANLGWRVVEGNQCTGLSGPVACTDPTLTAPVITYTHSVGCSVTGGFVYRGAAVPSLAGRYVYGDFCSGRIWAAQKVGTGLWTPAELGDTAFGISGFGEDDAGELYFADYGTGDVYRFAETTPPASPVLAQSATSLDFGAVAVGQTSATQTITLSNAGGGTLAIGAVSLPSSVWTPQEFLKGGTCAAGTNLAAAQSCTVTIAFRPVANGARASTLTITTNGGNGTVALAGVGGASPPATPLLSAVPGTLAFGSVVLGSTSTPLTTTVTNAGGGTLAIASLTPGGANAGDFARTGTCAAGTNLAAGQSCTVIHRFTPTATGVRSATLGVATNGGSATLNLTGTGVAAPTGPVLAVSATTLDLGAVPIGRKGAPRTIAVANSGSGTITVSALTPGGANPGEFLVAGSCAPGTVLAAAQSCTIVFTFAPAAVGDRSASLAIVTTAGSATVALRGTGLRGRN